uniref:formimidoyltransferase-cyclodeaminase n=1 Tax=Myxine glutinosa TaxID=7769 RepID=UPI00358E4AC9
MAKIIECVANFSEGRRKEVIDEIATSLRQVDGCSLLDVDAGLSTNRTVYTFVGSPHAVVEGALNAARTAFRLIDMTRHHGEHPRLGALDVCPFIPLQGATMEDCIQCAHNFAKQLVHELEVPVYLYGAAAQEPKRELLPSIRVGEYEELPKKLKDPAWRPDYGPAKFVGSWGATVVGVRKFLIAYNVNLLSTKEQAHRIALNIRQQGRGKESGRLRCVQAIGWYICEEDMAQVSTNITNFEVTPIHKVYEEVSKDAAELKLPVVGSQVVGLLPFQAMMTAAEYYMEKEKLFILDEEHKIRLVVSRLGLDSLGPFKPKEKIIEYMISREDEFPLSKLPLQMFIRNVGARTAAPGGGSVSAAIAAMGAALGSMVGLMSYGKRQFEKEDPVMREHIPVLHNAMLELTKAVDKDSIAFSGYMDALKMPKTTQEESERRDAALQTALRMAVHVPLTMAQRVDAVWPAMAAMAQHGNVACKSDIQVGAKALELGVEGASYNVLINLEGLTDEKFKSEVQEDMQKLVKRARACAADVLRILQKGQ